MSTPRRIAAGLGVGALTLAATAVVPSQAASVDAASAQAAQRPSYQVLVVGKTLGYRHSHIDETTQAVIDLGEENGFTVDVWDPPTAGSEGQPELTMASTPFVSARHLARYKTIIFASPVDGTNDQDPARPRLLDNGELRALKGYVRGGGGFVGLHAATDAMHAKPWYSKLTGGEARFAGHPQQQTATMRVESPTHPSTEMLPKEWVRFDEWYNFTSNPREDVHVLLTLDESTYEGGTMGADHPIAWCHNFQGGRSWYEGAGHVDESYADPLFLDHLLGGIEWTAGVVKGGGDCVTFAEVDTIVADVAQGPKKAAKVARKVARLLDRAEARHDAGRHQAAAQVLLKARAKARDLRDRTLARKIGDLVEWQVGLIRY